MGNLINLIIIIEDFEHIEEVNYFKVEYFIEEIKIMVNLQEDYFIKYYFHQIMIIYFIGFINFIY